MRQSAAIGIIAATISVAVLSPSHSADLSVFGPGGPAPAMRAAAEAFGEARGVEVEVTAGPTGQWIDAAREGADLVYSGSETMMTDFVGMMEGQLSDLDVRPLYLRASAILVRPGNPDGIEGIEDLLDEGRRIVVVNGAGQDGLWEDIAGRLGDIDTVRDLRANIAVFAANSAEARDIWTTNTDLDAWIIWTIWQRANPDLADLVEIEEPYRIHRPVSIAPTTRGKENALAAEFAAFLESAEGAAIFERLGWIADGTDR